MSPISWGIHPRLFYLRHVNKVVDWLIDMQGNRGLWTVYLDWKQQTSLLAYQRFSEFHHLHLHLPRPLSNVALNQNQTNSTFTFSYVLPDQSVLRTDIQCNEYKFKSANLIHHLWNFSSPYLMKPGEIPCSAIQDNQVLQDNWTLHCLFQLHYQQLPTNESLY